MLAHQLEELPPLTQFWGELPDFFSWLHELQIAPEPAAFHLGATENLWSPGRITRSTSSAIQRIQFAAANRVCIRLRYNGEVRLVEPYSFRTNNDNAQLFYGFHREDRQMKCFRVDRFESVEVTREAFAPRYKIEISSAGSVSMLPVSIRKELEHPGFASSPKRAKAAKPSKPKVRRAPPTRTSLVFTFQCPVCKKRFKRDRYESKLNTHKGKNGYPCPGSYGVPVR